MICVSHDICLSHDMCVISSIPYVRHMILCVIQSMPSCVRRSVPSCPCSGSFHDVCHPIHVCPVICACIHCQLLVLGAWSCGRRARPPWRRRLRRHSFQRSSGSRSGRIDLPSVRWTRSRFANSKINLGSSTSPEAPAASGTTA